MFDRPIFFYRGDTLFNLRYGDYKAHFYTWNTPQEAIDIVSSCLWIISEKIRNNHMGRFAYCQKVSFGKNVGVSDLL